jgi:DNA-binding response OmpR family regulator
MATLLVVDDDIHTLDVLTFSLGLEGHEVVRAADGRAALAMAERVQPDAIILDVMMPLVDGFTATRRLRQMPAFATIPILLLTARATDADVWEGWRAGADSYVTKPLDVDVLHDELARLGVHSTSEPLAGASR